MKKSNSTNRQKQSSRQAARKDSETRQGFKIHFDSIGGPFIDLNKELSSEAGKKIFEKLRKVS